MPRIVKVPLSTEKGRELEGFLYEKFDAAVRARTNQVEDKYRRWMDNYAAKPREEIRTTPFYRAANFVPQLIRMHTDILTARILGIVFGTKPVWFPRGFGDNVPATWLLQLGAWLEHLTMNELDFFNVMDSTVFRTVKTGTQVVKWPWVDQTRYIGAVDDTNPQGFKSTPVGRQGIKGCNIPFDDLWVYPVTANNLEEASVIFHRYRFSKDEVESTGKQLGWSEEAIKALLESPVEKKDEQARDSQAQEAGIQLTKDVIRPYNVIEAWLKYPISNDGNYYEIVAQFNPQRKTGSNLLTFFNYYTNGERPFVDWRICPREDLFYGMTIPEQLEQCQEEKAQIHNGRRDSNTVANIPGWKKKRLADVPDPSAEWYPGKTFVLDDMDDLQILEFNRNYNSMIEEEQYLDQQAERMTGISAPMQGMGAGSMQGKRGIYGTGGTLAMLAEGNRRLDIYIKRIRSSFHKTGSLIYISERDFNPQHAGLKLRGEAGQNVIQTFDFKEPDGLKHLFFDIGASESSSNKETERTSLLLCANTMAAYYKEILQLGQYVVQIKDPNHPYLKLILQITDGAKELADRLLFVFDVGGRDKLVPDLRKILAGGAQQADVAAQRAGLQPPEGDVSNSDMAGISEFMASLQSARAGGSGNGEGPSYDL